MCFALTCCQKVWMSVAPVSGVGKMCFALSQNSKWHVGIYFLCKTAMVVQ